MMKIAGLQKLTLLDYPGKVACTVFTSGCNFRCPFCHNSSLISDSDEMISQADFFSWLKTRQGILDGVAITGGEPLLQKDIYDFICKIKELGFLVKLDTNGSFPEILKHLIEHHAVDRVSMDIKNSPGDFIRTAGCSPHFVKAVGESKNLLMQGQVEYEFRTTIVKGLHTIDNMKALSIALKDAKEYYLQQYINSGNVLHPEGLESFSDDEMHELLAIVQQNVPNAKLRGID